MRICGTNSRIHYSCLSRRRGNRAATGAPLLVLVSSRTVRVPFTRSCTVDHADEAFHWNTIMFAGSLRTTLLGWLLGPLPVLYTLSLSCCRNQSVRTIRSRRVLAGAFPLSCVRPCSRTRESSCHLRPCQASTSISCSSRVSPCIFQRALEQRILCVSHAACGAL